MENYLQELIPLGNLFMTQMMMNKLTALPFSANRTLTLAGKTLLKLLAIANMIAIKNLKIQLSF